jgi:hypothetical protein
VLSKVAFVLSEIDGQWPKVWLDKQIFEEICIVGLRYLELSWVFEGWGSTESLNMRLPIHGSNQAIRTGLFLMLQDSSVRSCAKEAWKGTTMSVYLPS